MVLKDYIKDLVFQYWELWFTEVFTSVHLIPLNLLFSKSQHSTTFLLNSLLLKLSLLVPVLFLIPLILSEEDLWCNPEEKELMERKNFYITEPLIVSEKLMKKKDLKLSSKELYQTLSEESELL